MPEKRLQITTLFMGNIFFAMILVLLLWGKSRGYLPLESDAMNENANVNWNIQGEQKTEISVEPSTENNKDYLEISFPGAKGNDAFVWNDLYSQCLYVSLADFTTDDIRKIEIDADFEWITKISFQSMKSDQRLKIILNDICENEWKYENGKLTIQFAPKGTFEQPKVLLSPGTTPLSRESCILLARKLKQENVDVYFTNADEQQLTASVYQELAKKLEPDLFLTVTVNLEEDKSDNEINITYNPLYFIPTFDSADFAACLKKACLNAQRENVNLLEIETKSDKEEETIYLQEVPACSIAFLYPCDTNKEDKRILEDTEIIYQAIRAAVFMTGEKTQE